MDNTSKRGEGLADGLGKELQQQSDFVQDLGEGRVGDAAGNLGSGLPSCIDDQSNATYSIATNARIYWVDSQFNA